MKLFEGERTSYPPLDNTQIQDALLEGDLGKTFFSFIIFCLLEICLDGLAIQYETT